MTLRSKTWIQTAGQEQDAGVGQEWSEQEEHRASQERTFQRTYDRYERSPSDYCCRESDALTSVSMRAMDAGKNITTVYETLTSTTVVTPIKIYFQKDLNCLCCQNNI